MDDYPWRYLLLKAKQILVNIYGGYRVFSIFCRALTLHRQRLHKNECRINSKHFLFSTFSETFLVVFPEKLESKRGELANNFCTIWLNSPKSEPTGRNSHMAKDVPKKQPIFPQLASPQEEYTLCILLVPLSLNEVF